MAVVGLKERAIRVGYILGISLVLAAIIYFFASNWPSLEKNVKVALSVGLLTLFYGVAYILTMFSKKRPFLSELLLFAGTISFGVTIALLGQIYNSHADSYLLFLIWLVPVLLFCFVTRYEPFYLLAFILFHLAVWFFLFPSFSFFSMDIWMIRIFLLVVSGINLAFFFLLEVKWRSMKALPWLVFFVPHLSLFVLSMGLWSERFPFAMSFVYFGILIWLFRYFLLKDRGGYIVFIAIAAALLLIGRFIVFVAYIGYEYIFLLTLLIPILLIWLAVYLIRKFRKHNLLQKPMVRRALIAFIVISASTIAARSILGIVYLILGWEIEMYVFLLIAIFCFFVPILIKKNWDDVIRYTMLLTGIMLATWSALISNEWWLLLYTFVLIALYIRMQGMIVKYVLYALMNGMLLLFLFRILDSYEIGLLLVCCLNFAIVYLCRLISNERAAILYMNGFIYGLLSAFVLTFLNSEFMMFYFLTNGIFFIITTWFIFSSLRTENRFVFRLSLLFWFLFVVYKYYDLLWALLHKSLTFFIAGAMILLITKYADRGAMPEALPRRGKWIAIGFIILLQFAIISGQIVKSERVLAQGELIKLQLEPVDPRSMLQGDYVILRYSISHIKQVESLDFYAKVYVGLVKNQDGIYEYKQVLTKEQFVKSTDQESVDLWIAGKHLGGGMIAYGIENYFIQEGTGAQYERKVTTAYVKVAKNGDAILLSIE